MIGGDRHDLAWSVSKEDTSIYMQSDVLAFRFLWFYILLSGWGIGHGSLSG